MPKFRTPGGISDAFYQALTNLSPNSEGKTAKQWATDLVKRSGGTRAAANLAGVSQRTMQKWVKGVQAPKGENADNLKRAQRSARIKPGRVQKMQNALGVMAGGGGLQVKAKVTVSNDTRTRWLNLSGNIPPEAAEHLVQVMTEQGNAAAHGYLEYLINDVYAADCSAPMHVENIEHITW